MLIGYARVSTRDQDVGAQQAALHRAGCERIFSDVASGGRWNRPELQNLLQHHLRKGDVLVVWKLDRLSRSLSDLIAIMQRIHVAGAGFRSITEQIDTTTAAGRMLMHIAGTFAEFELSLLRERTAAGIAAARARGRRIGRRSKLTTHQWDELLKMMEPGDDDTPGKTPAEVARLFNVHRSTVVRYVERHRAKQQGAL